jgi:hypothetical protein
MVSIAIIDFVNNYCCMCSYVILIIKEVLTTLACISVIVALQSGAFSVVYLLLDYLLGGNL